MALGGTMVSALLCVWGCRRDCACHKCYRVCPCDHEMFQVAQAAMPR